MTAGVGLRELFFQRGIAGIGKGRRHIVLKEVNDARQLLDGDLGVDVRRVLEIHARVVEQRRHLFFARNQGAQAIVRRSKFALHERESAVGQSRSNSCRDSFPMDESSQA